MRSVLVLSVLTLYVGIVQAQPQTFSSGSTGADGPLTYAANLGTVYFPPSGLAQRANNIYNFTAITIGTGTTVRLSGWVINGPVYWLAQSDVTITMSGTLDLSGQPGHPPNNPSLRAPSEPGAGGGPRHLTVLQYRTRVFQAIFWEAVTSRPSLAARVALAEATLQTTRCRMWGRWRGRYPDREYDKNRGQWNYQCAGGYPPGQL
jgi:hypothetical protein